MYAQALPRAIYHYLQAIGLTGSENWDILEVEGVCIVCLYHNSTGFTIQARSNVNPHWI